MTGKKEDKREDLRARLITAATRRIEESGLAALRARDLAADARCALGALYTVFEDIDNLVLEVNAGTLRRINTAVEEAMATNPDPAQQLRQIARTYLNFARRNLRAWRALFEHALPEEAALPDWYGVLLAKLLAHIEEPLGRLQPGLGGQSLLIRARTLFAAVHGIVSINLDYRFVGVPADTLDKELDSFLSLVLAGAREAK